MKKIITLILVFTTTLLFSQVPNYVPTNGLVGWWPFTGNANDLSGNGNNGVVNGATLTLDRLGNANSAYSFNGINTSIQVQSNSTLLLTNNYSLNGWFNANVFFNTNNSDRSIISKVSSTGWYNGYEVMVGGNTNDIVHVGNVGGNNFILGNSGYLINTWYMFSVTFDGNTMKLFMNGSLVNSQTQTGNIQTGNIPLRFGMREGNFQYFNGKIDDIGIWNRALTQQEITNLYNASLSTEDFAINDINIYPNPTTSFLNYKSSIQVEKIVIYNMLGQVVQQEKINALEGTINIEKLAQGTYLVKVNDIDKGYTIIKN
jgi:hypothetical protein